MASAEPGPAAPARAGGVSARIFRFFASPWVGLISGLLVALALWVALAEDPGRSLEDRWAAWDCRPDCEYPLKLVLFQLLELHAVLHAWWFELSLLMLVLHLLALNLERLPWLLGRASSAVPPPVLPVRYQAEFSLLRTDGLAERLSTLLGAVVQPARGHDEWRATRHAAALWALPMVHAGLLLIALGGLMTSHMGLDGTLAVAEGASSSVVLARGAMGATLREDLGFSVKVERLRVQTLPDDTPLEVESELAILQNGTRVAGGLVRAHQALRFRGFTLTQAGYRPMPGDERIRLEIGRKGEPGRLHTVKVGTRIPVPGTQTTFIPVELLPQYANLGPALKVQQVTDGQPNTQFMVFQNQPAFDQDVRQGDFHLRYRGANRTYMSGIHVVRAPGLPLVYAGLLGVVVGLLLAWRRRPQHWRASIRSADGQKATVMLFAASPHAWQPFEPEWHRILGALKVPS